MASSEQREEFWDRLEDCRSGMLDVGGRAMPMTHNLEPEDGNIWFLTAKGTDMADAAFAGDAARYIVCNDDKAIYAQVDGTLAAVDDAQKLDEVWSAMASLWFDEGKRDPDLVLVRLSPAKAEVWLGPESGIKFLWSAAKAKVTGEEPDMGDHFELTF